MGIRDRLLSGAARQLGKPEGVTGRLLAIGLNRGNRGIVTAAVHAAQIAPGDRVADIGFGGGLSLALLLDRVGLNGHVDGIELSDTMLKSAQRRFREGILGWPPGPAPWLNHPNTARQRLTGCAHYGQHHLLRRQP